MKANNQHQALAKRGATRDVAQIANVVRAFEADQSTIVLTPSSAISHIPDDHALVVRQLVFDPMRDFYFTGRNAYALHKGPLERIAAAAGIQWDVDRCKRIDDRSDPNYCEFQAVGAVRDPQTGVIMRKKGTKHYDLRDGSAQVEEIYEKHRKDINNHGRGRSYKSADEADRAARAEVNQLRTNIVERAETGAYLRVIRSVTSVRTNYTSDERGKTFVLVSMVYQPEDPEIRRLHRLQAARAAQDLFYGGRGFGDVGIIDVEPVQPVRPPAIEPAPERRGLEVEAAPTYPPQEDVDQGGAAPWDGPLPAVADFVDASRDERVAITIRAIEVASYDYEGVMAEHGRHGTPVSALSDKALQALYEACWEQIPVGDYRDYTDDDIPF